MAFCEGYANGVDNLYFRASNRSRADCFDRSFSARNSAVFINYWE